MLKDISNFFQYNFVIVWIANILKVLLIWVVDFVNWVYNPFETLSRPITPKYDELLFVKAKKFENDLVNNFLLYNAIWNYRKPTDGSVDTGDQALHHGLATAYWALKYSITASPDDLFYFKNSVSGLDAHQTIHGEPTRRLVRGFRLMTDAEKSQNLTNWSNGDQLFFTVPSKSLVVEDNVSNDTISGHLLGIYFSWLYGTEEIQDQCKTLIRGLADELLNNNHSVINQDGTPTEYGQLALGVLADPLRTSLLSAVYIVAHIITADDKYITAHNEIEEQYNILFPYAKLFLLWWGNDEDDHRAAIHLSILADFDSAYTKGLSRTWNISKHHMNIWTAFLAHRHGVLSGQDVTDCKGILSEFTLEDKQTDIQKDNSADFPDIKTFSWGGNQRRAQPLPRWQCSGQDFVYQRCLNAVADWTGNTQPTQYFQGIDFLLCWALGRRLNIISDKE